ncbi:MAG: transposase [Microthrixaceae bacterium]
MLGDVGSDTTFRRMIADLAKTPGSTGAIDEVMREIRTRVWAEHGWSDPGRRVLLDIGATLTRVHSEKEDAKGNYKRGFGFHPVACFADCSGEALAVEHRPGNAGANTIADLVGIIDAGLDALPESVAQSHRPGAVTADATSEILVLLRFGRAHPRIPLGHVGPQPQVLCHRPLEQHLELGDPRLRREHQLGERFAAQRCRLGRQRF